MVNLKIGDVITTNCDDCEFEVTDLPGCSEYFTDYYRGIDHEDGQHGLFPIEHVKTVNGVPIEDFVRNEDGGETMNLEGKFKIGDDVQVKQQHGCVNDVRKYMGKPCKVIGLGYNPDHPYYRSGVVVTVHHPEEGFLALYEEAFEKAVHPLVGKTILMRATENNNAYPRGNMFLGVVTAVDTGEDSDYLNGYKVDSRGRETGENFNCWMDKFEYVVLDDLKFTQDI